MLNANLQNAINVFNLENKSYGVKEVTRSRGSRAGVGALGIMIGAPGIGGPGGAGLGGGGQEKADQE